IGAIPFSVYAVLAFYGRFSGKAWPSCATIARHLGLSDRTVQRSLTALRKAGLVRMEVSTDCKTPNVYHLLPVHPTGDCVSPVTVSHPTGDTRSPPPVTVSHPTGDTRSGERDVLKETKEEDVRRETNTPQPPSRGGRRERRKRSTIPTP